MSHDVPVCLPGVYGPPVGKRCVLFVDDLNLPQTDAFGTHPPLELLRQLVDHATWYDIRKEVEPIRLEDMQVSSQPVVLLCLWVPNESSFTLCKYDNPCSQELNEFSIGLS